jgi:ubiquinone/menaquinone biosynthesis C-methylase UbiE
MGIYSDIVFPKFYDLICKHKGFNNHRSALLSKVTAGKILEIGIGTGINMDFYPPQIAELSAIDPNPGMEKQLRDKLKNRKIKINFIRAGAEDLPFQDGSFDTVISTLTMCSIPNLGKALSEIKRVLKFDGKLFFLDHGLSRDPKIERIQRILNPIQKVIGCGCQLTVDIEHELIQAGFKILSLNVFYLENAPKFLGHVYEGFAGK